MAGNLMAVVVHVFDERIIVAGGETVRTVLSHDEEGARDTVLVESVDDAGGQGTRSVVEGQGDFTRGNAGKNLAAIGNIAGVRSRDSSGCVGGFSGEAGGGGGDLGHGHEGRKERKGRSAKKHCE